MFGMRRDYFRGGAEKHSTKMKMDSPPRRTDLQISLVWCRAPSPDTPRNDSLRNDCLNPVPHSRHSSGRCDLYLGEYRTSVRRGRLHEDEDGYQPSRCGASHLSPPLPSLVDFD